jgi:hypothetical protein
MNYEYLDKYLFIVENCATERRRREEKRNEWDWEEKRREEDEEVFIHLMAVPTMI